MKMLKSLGIAMASTATMVVVTAQVSRAVVIGPGSYVFQNPSNMTASDFDVTLLTPPPPAINFAASNGGAPFPNKAANAARTFIRYFGPPGVPGGGLYAHSFPGWPAGTMFDVVFTYGDPTNLDNPTQDPIIVQSFAPGEEDQYLQELNNLGISPDQAGETVSAPEPTSIFSLLALSSLGVASTLKRKLKLSKATDKETGKIG